MISSARHPAGPLTRLGLALTAVVAVFAASGCTGGADTATSSSQLTIGFLAQMDTRTGTDAVRGAQLAADIVNRSYPDVALPFGAETGLPGLDGAQVNLVIADTKGSPEQADTEASTIATNHHADALITFGSAEVAAAVGAQSAQLRVPVVDAWSTADYLPEMGMDWYFRTRASDRSLATTAFALLRRQLGAAGSDKHRLILIADDMQSTIQTNVVRELSKRAGYQIVETLPLPSGSTISATARAVDRAHGDVLIAVTSDTTQAANAAKVASRIDRQLPIIGLGSGFASLRADAAPDAPALLRTASWSDEFSERNPLAFQVASLYQQHFDARMTEAAANGFTAVMVLATAASDAGTTVSTSLRSGLRQLWLPATKIIMPWDGIRFAGDGQNQLAAAVIEARVAQRYRVVFPREISDTRVVWVTPPESTP